METTELYCTVGVCLCTAFEDDGLRYPYDAPTGDEECVRCQHPLRAHAPNTDE